MKKLLTASAMTAALVSAPLASQAATGQTDVTFTMPGIIILHYASDITVAVEASYFGGADQSFADAAAKSLTGFDDDAAVSVADGPDAAVNNATSIIRNAWAVRSLSSSGNSQVEITLDTDTGTHTNGDTLTVSNPQVSADGTTFGATASFSSPGLARPNAEYGDVSLDLDMSTVTSAGDFTGVQYTVEATNI